MKIVNYIDVEVEKLKTELVLLEEKISTLSQIKSDCGNQIYNFNLEHHKYLGAISEEILKLKIELGKEKFKKNEITKEELLSIQEDYFKYKEMLFYEDEEPYILKKEEEKELKILYRKASRLTHPDIVSSFFKEEASEVFISLNHAYKRKDLEAVKNILEKLKKEIDFLVDIDEVSNKSYFLQKIKIVNNKLNYYGLLVYSGLFPKIKHQQPTTIF